jgi:hypothetical protein
VRRQDLQFVGRQRQALQDPCPLRKNWLLRHGPISGEEALRIRAFVEALPAGGTFSFEDPWTGGVYDGCRIAGNIFELLCRADGGYDVNVEVEYAG